MDQSIDELFPTDPEAVRTILAEIRAVARASLPGAAETFYHGALGYGPTASGFDRVIYVQPQRGYVNLGFFFGTSVADPTGLLEGTGKRMRHTKIRSVADARNPALVSLLQDGWASGVAAVAQLHASRGKRG